jgi:hypothetical protein
MKLNMRKFVTAVESPEYGRGRFDKELYKLLIETVGDNFIKTSPDKTQDVVFSLYSMANCISGLWEYISYELEHKDFLRKFYSDVEKYLKTNGSEIRGLNDSQYFVLKACFFMTYPGKN